jgi:hypothetical protein
LDLPDPPVFPFFPPALAPFLSLPPFGVEDISCSCHKSLENAWLGQADVLQAVRVRYEKSPVVTGNVVMPLVSADLAVLVSSLPHL